MTDDAARAALERLVAERLARRFCDESEAGAGWLAVAREALSLATEAIRRDRFESMRQVHLIDPIAAQQVLQPDGPIDLAAALGEEPKP